MDKTKTAWGHIDPSGQQLRPVEVCALTGLSKSQIYNLISEGFFPPFLKIGKRASALPQAWLNAYLRDKADAITEGGLSYE